MYLSIYLFIFLSIYLSTVQNTFHKWFAVTLHYIISYSEKLDRVLGVKNSLFHKLINSYKAL